MSTDAEVHDPFEAELAARMGAATEAVTASGVTREGVDERLAARRSTRRRRQGGLLVAAALVVAAGIGAVVTAGGEPETSVQADQGGSTEAPTTAAPTTECPPWTVASGETVPDPILPGAAGQDCPEHAIGSTTMPPTTIAPSTEPPPATEAPPETTAPPATEPPTTTASPTTQEELVLDPGDPCTPGTVDDCVDPEGDGSHTYLVGGDACMASSPDASLCTDLDGDGTAGYPDSEGQSYQPDLDGDGQPGYPDSR